MFEWVPVAALADACVRLGRAPRVPEAGLRPARAGWRVVGPALPVRHAGSVDVFFEVLERARAGDVLVVDNEGRWDEACVGDLVAWDAKLAGAAGILVWGLHRDTADVLDVGLPLFSYGTLGAGPAPRAARGPLLGAREDRGAAGGAIRLGGVPVEEGDLVVADDDGAIVIPRAEAEEAWRVARAIWRTERAQADRARAGVSMREQLRFRDYLAARGNDPALTFRAHLRGLGASVEE